MESKLFVGGIKREVDENILQNYFRKYGDVKEAVVIYSRETRISRGFGFVTFKDSSAVDIALQDAHTDTILGQKVDVRPAKSKTRPQYGYGSPEIMTKIFVGGLPHNLMEEEFKNFFARFGVIIDSVVVRDKETNRPRGFGFVTYDSKDAADFVLQNRFYMLNGNNVEVKRAEPKEAKLDKSYMNQNGASYGTGGCGLINNNMFDCSFSHYAPCHAIPIQCVHGHSIVLPCSAIHPNGYDFPWANDVGCAYNIFSGYNGWCSSGFIGQVDEVSKHVKRSGSWDENVENLKGGIDGQDKEGEKGGDGKEEMSEDNGEIKEGAHDKDVLLVITQEQ